MDIWLNYTNQNSICVLVYWNYNDQQSIVAPQNTANPTKVKVTQLSQIEYEVAHESAVVYAISSMCNSASIHLSMETAYSMAESSFE